MSLSPQTYDGIQVLLCFFKLSSVLLLLPEKHRNKEILEEKGDYRYKVSPTLEETRTMMLFQTGKKGNLDGNIVSQHSFRVKCSLQC